MITETHPSFIYTPAFIATILSIVNKDPDYEIHIHYNGTVEIKNIELNEAAKLFWEHVESWAKQSDLVKQLQIGGGVSI